MKAIITLGILLTAASLLSGCNKTSRETPVAADSPPAIEAERPPLIVLEKPAAAPPVVSIAVQRAAPPVVPQNPFAPQGVYFLARKVSMETKSGIISAPAGTRVEKQSNGTFKTANGNTFKLTASDLTNDLRLAGQLSNHDARVQAAARSAAATVSEPQTAPLTPSAPTAFAPPVAGLRKPAGAAPASTLGASSGLNSGAYGKKKVFIDKDGDGRAFETRSGASRNPYDGGK